jgi:hypothetical protein
MSDSRYASLEMLSTPSMKAAGPSTGWVGSLPGTSSVTLLSVACVKNPGLVVESENLFFRNNTPPMIIKSLMFQKLTFPMWLL